LPYDVKIELMPVTRGKCVTLTPIILHDYFVSDNVNYLPYLRPMSSMTEEEIKEWDNICVMMRNMPVESIPMIERFVNSKHLDYYNLILKGLALPAPEDMYNF
jgi:hypothetical protein